MGFLEGVAVGVVASLVAAAIGFFGRRRWLVLDEDRQEERMLWAFLELATEANSHEKLAVPVFVRKATEQAGVRDPDAVLQRLVRKGHLVKTFPYDPDYYSLTFEGRERAYNLRPARPNLWQLLSGK